MSGAFYLYSSEGKNYLASLNGKLISPELNVI